MNSYESKREINSSYIDGSEDGQGSDNLYNAEIKWERELLKQIDEFNKEYGENRNNRRKNNEGSRKNNKYSVSNNEELDNSSFSNTKYSVSNDTDNQGRKLSEKQQEYFKDSKVRDKKGNLRVLYNGSGEHTVYNPAYMSDESKWGKGIYLTPFKDVAEQYGSNIKEAYVDIKNPLEPGKSLINNFKDYCKSNGINNLKVTASYKNKNAIEFYKKSGFEEFDLTLTTRI